MIKFVAEILWMVVKRERVPPFFANKTLERFTGSNSSSGRHQLFYEGYMHFRLRVNTFLHLQREHGVYARCSFTGNKAKMKPRHSPSAAICCVSIASCVNTSVEAKHLRR